MYSDNLVEVVAFDFEEKLLYLADGREVSIAKLRQCELDEMRQAKEMNEHCGADYVITVDVEDGYVVYFEY